MDILEWRFTVVRKVLLDLTISLVFTTLGNKPEKFNFVHQTVACWETHAVWAQDCTALLLAACVAVIF